MKQAVGFSIWERVKGGGRGKEGCNRGEPRCLCQLIFGTLASSSASSPWLYKQTTAWSSLTIKHRLIKPSPLDKPELSSRMCSEPIELLKIYLHSSFTSSFPHKRPSAIRLGRHLTSRSVGYCYLGGAVFLQGIGALLYEDKATFTFSVFTLFHRDVLQEANPLTLFNSMMLRHSRPWHGPINGMWISPPPRGCEPSFSERPL